MTDTLEPKNPTEQESVKESPMAQEVTTSPATEAAPTNEPAETMNETQNENTTPTVEENIQHTAEVIERLKVLAEDPLSVNKEELDSLKQAYYKLHRAEMEHARQAFVEAGGEAADFVFNENNEEEYKAVMGTIKEKRAEQQREEERQREENLLRKQAILDQIIAMVENADKEQASYNDFKALQQQWKEIKEVPASASTELWKNYQHYTEKFYDILKLNIEFREYDFKKNLEAKLRLCETAEALTEEKDVISAFHQLQELHQEFREIGPVAKELREEVWNRFKTASTTINKRHQQHFEDLKAKEEENLNKKTALCEAVENIPYESLTSFQQWNDTTQEILALQEQWKTIGFAPQKMNTKIFERFRAACDVFFQRKGEFFKNIKDTLAQNLEKKIALCERAEALKDSTDWKATADKLSALQKEWKTIGPVHKKHSDAVWKRFIAACDAFFEKRNAANSSQRSEEMDNLTKKKAVIDALSQLSPDNLSEEDAQKMHDLIREWNSIGHVPFKDKDKLYKKYKALIDALFDGLHKQNSDLKLRNFKSSIKEGMNVQRERERLLRAYDNLCNEIKTYENNLGFLSTSSKSGNSLVNEMMHKMEKLKADAEVILKKIKALEEQEEKTAE